MADPAHTGERNEGVSFSPSPAPSGSRSSPTLPTWDSFVGGITSVINSGVHAVGSAVHSLANVPPTSSSPPTTSTSNLGTHPSSALQLTPARVDSEYRRLWLVYSDDPRFRLHELKATYAALLASALSSGKLTADIVKHFDAIERDVGRTFSGTEIDTPAARDRLRRVLAVYAMYDPDVGYCQSLNFIAAFICSFINSVCGVLYAAPCVPI
jgi:hypothetical protein